MDSSSGLCVVEEQDAAIRWIFTRAKKKETGSMIKDTLGRKVVLAMMQHLDNKSDHEIYLDNFFTSYKLLAHM